MANSINWTNGVVAIYGRAAAGIGPIGTGFVISSAGHILTCAHFLDQAGWPYQEWVTPVQVRFNAKVDSAGRGPPPPGATPWP